jgi:GNAT superfamily N-acetyltransferase
MSRPKKAPLPEVEIRLAVPGDEAVMESLILQAFEPFREQYTPGAFDYTAIKADKISERFAEGPMWLAYIDGEPVGTVSGLPEEGRFYIRSMAVKPSAQGKHVGQRLLEELEIYAREARFEKLFLYTTFILPAAHRLYEKNGFYVVRETATEEWFDMGGLEMEKILD